MKIDLYTRTVLTGILLCLVWLCVALTPVGIPLTAQTVVLPGQSTAGAVQDVRIVAVKQPEMVRTPGAAPRPGGDWDSLPTYQAPQAQAAPGVK
jgi:hypothetical protein